MTITKKHNKHTKLARPAIGDYGRCEVGILGATCDRIKQLTGAISQQLSPDLNVCYIDADHQAGDIPSYGVLTDAINHHRLQWSGHFSTYDQKALLQSYDVTLVNCNHFAASHQIVCCTEKKKESLSRKLHKLTDVKLILLDEGIDQPYEFLQSIITVQQPQIAKITDIAAIAQVIRELYRITNPPIKMLILAGGRSTRMGSDKPQLSYHGDIPQWKYLIELAKAINIEPYISCREDQVGDYEGYPTITDTYLDLGPYGALLSAFREDPNAAWLSVASDLPLLKTTHLQTLLDALDHSKTATCYHNPTTSWPEPMLTIWMPRAYQSLLKFLGLGYSCPRKVLINCDVHEVHAADSTFLLNANTPKDRDQAIKLLG